MCVLTSACGSSEGIIVSTFNRLAYILYTTIMNVKNTELFFIPNNQGSHNVQIRDVMLFALFLQDEIVIA